MPITRVDLTAALKVIESLALGLDLAGTPTITHQVTPSTDTEKQLTPTSTPAVSKAFSDSVQLTAGAASLDLAALAGPLSTAIDMTGLKVQAILVLADAANTDVVTVDVGATNGYNIFGTAGSELALAAGGFALFYSPEGLPDVGAAAKTIDLSSPDTDAIVKVIIVAG